ncbi:hypothetical protein CQA53_11920, partial [Helicobacter didelphidarum]
PFTKACLSSKDKTLANDPKNVSPTDTLSLRTQNFVNRYELVHHIPDIASLDTLLAFLTGYSATLFYDTDNKNYILAFRGTEMLVRDTIKTDLFVALGVGIDQIIAMETLANRLFKSIYIHHKEKEKEKELDSNKLPTYKTYKEIKQLIKNELQQINDNTKDSNKTQDFITLFKSLNIKII